MINQVVQNGPIRLLSGVELEINNLEQNIHLLSGVISDLETKLSPVIRNSAEYVGAPTSPNKDGIEPYGVSLHKSLFNRNKELVKFISELNIIIDRIDL